MEPDWNRYFGYYLPSHHHFVGVHIGIALGVTGFLVMSFIMGVDAAMRMATESIYFANASYALVTLPLFILMGYLGAGGGISKILYDGLSKWTGKLRGSLGIATVLGCAGFGAVCGSSIVMPRFCEGERSRNEAPRV